jgi:anti-sigma-K factor RskA
MVSGAALALAAGLAAVLVVDRLPLWLGTPPAAGARYVAVVNRDASLPALIVDVDTAAGVVTVRPVAAEQPADKSLELWVIPEGEKPRSLGVVDPKDAVIRIGAEKSGPIPAKGVFAVTVEPPGGSPSGDPTGPVVYSGPLIPTD